MPSESKADWCKICCFYQLLESDNRKEIKTLNLWLEAFCFNQKKCNTMRTAVLLISDNSNQVVC